MSRREITPHAMTAAEPARIKKKIRRDSDPVRVFADGRIAYYPSGVVGSGDRQWFRCGSVAVADERAAQLRFDLAALAHLGPRERGSFFNLMTAMLRHHEAVKIPQGSIKQYRSNWNTWVPESVREAPCHTLDVEHWTLIFDGLTAAHASPGRRVPWSGGV